MLPISQNEDWGLPQNDLYHLYFASWSTATSADCSLVGYKFASNAKINLTMQDTVTDANSNVHNVTEIYGTAGANGTGTPGIFS
jgi:hypothetical protein